MTRQELADQIGVSVRTVGRYETGDRKPDESTQKKIAGCLGVTMEELGWKEDPETTVGIETVKKEEMKTESRMEETVQSVNWWEEEGKDEERKEPEELLCAFRARPDKYDKSVKYFPPCFRERCSAYRNGKCVLKWNSTI